MTPCSFSVIKYISKLIKLGEHGSLLFHLPYFFFQLGRLSFLDLGSNSKDCLFEITAPKDNGSVLKIRCKSKPVNFEGQLAALSRVFDPYSTDPLQSPTTLSYYCYICPALHCTLILATFMIPYQNTETKATSYNQHPHQL